MLTLLTILSAVLVAWGMVVTAVRWSPQALGFYPHATIASAVLYMVLAITYSNVTDPGARGQMLVLVHTCFAVSSLCWWWTSLRIAEAHGNPVDAPSWLTHMLPAAGAAVPIVAAFAGVQGVFISYDAMDEFTFHGGWFVLIGVLLSVSAATITLGLVRAWQARVTEDRLQYLCVAGATLAPSVLGSIAAANGGPIELMSLGYAIACAIVIVASYRWQIYPGLAVSLDVVWDTDPNACLVLDRYSRLIYANDSATNLLPAATSQRGANVRGWLAEALRDRGGNHLDVDTVLARDKATPRRVHLLRLAGQPQKLFACESRPMVARGHFVGTVLTFRDETTHENFREAALAARRMESLSHMAGGVAHRFNNLLVSVVGNVDIAKYEVESEPLNHQAVREILHDIQSAGQQAAELAKQLVTFTGNQLGHVEALDLNATVHEALALTSKRLPENVRCDVALAANTLMINGDRSQLIELVLNLVSNAQEAYGENAGSIRVTTGFRALAEGDLPEIYNRNGMAAGEYAFLEVTDHGPGLPQEIADRLFDPFVTTKEGAQGLGLATVLGTVVAHQGGVEVHTSSRGSRFTVYIPQLPAVERTDANPITVEPIMRETCLVVDDHAEVLNVHRAMLESLGKQTHATTSPTQALEMARMHRFELALVDVSMPEMRGDALVSLIREVDPELPVILVSGYSDEYTEADRLAGRTVFLEKPFGLAELHDAILQVAKPAVGGGADVVSISLVQDRSD